MTESDTALLSVRGTATVEVEPDCAAVDCDIRVTDRDKPKALAGASRELDAVRADLERLGGTARASGTRRAPLTWLARSMSASEEYDGKRHTGRIVASVTLSVELRDFALLDDVHRALAANSAVRLGSINWSVDDDNPAWPQVRAAAIDAALRQGHDYATALGGALLRIEQVADAGLLDGGRPQHFYRAHAMSGEAWVESEMPSVDPQPIELSASIDVRLLASVAPLT